MSSFRKLTAGLYRATGHGTTLNVKSKAKRVVSYPCRKWSSFQNETSTIYAVATGGLRSALSVVRVSGPKCLEVLQELGRYRDKKAKVPNPRQAVLRKFYDPSTNILLDHGILLWFPSPNSYTGEDCCEFHIHGGPAVITGMLKAIGSIPGCRIAGPGEFTKRAFLNGKMDLTEVDGLADLIAAETEMQRVQALKQMDGSLGQLYHGWRNRIAKCLANTEAYIDFGEDENIESDVMDNVIVETSSLQQEIENHLKDHSKGQRLRDGVRVAILGKPNVGKSSLLNKLCRREAAIVSSIPGTTRDVIEGCVNIQGFPVIFADTAGIREETEDLIENEGIQRSINEVEAADLVILMVDAEDALSISNDNQGCDGADDFKEIVWKMMMPDSRFSSPPTEKITLIVNKTDIIPLSPERTEIISLFDSAISCKTEEGLGQFQECLRQRIADICGNPSKDAPFITQERYRAELQHCVGHLQQFLSFQGSDMALRAHHLKDAINAIGRITGHVHSEEILDIIFRDFCIGK